MSRSIALAVAVLLGGCGTNTLDGNTPDLVTDALLDGGDLSAGSGACSPAKCAGCCQGEVCLPGTQAQACGTGGAACAPCATACSSGVCLGCKPGATQSSPCGNCGHAVATCGSDGKWGAPGSCTGEGACKPSATRTVGCGNCGRGSIAQLCSNSCQWANNGNCDNQPCAPGATEGGSCPNYPQTCTGTYTCDNNCSFQFTSCDGPTMCCKSSNAGQLCGTCKTCASGNCINGC